MNDSKVIIGRGSFGFVTLIDGDPKIAAKHLAKDSPRRDAFMKEYNALKSLQHLNIVKYYGFEEDGLFNVILMEYCERNSLYRVLNDPTIIYSMKTVLYWAEHLFSALCYLHKKEVVHRDIKAKNVLVKDDFFLKLADFGCVRDLNTSTTASLAGTYRYMSPEAYGYPERRLITPLNDLYSVGLILWEIVERRPAFMQYEHYEHFNYFALYYDLWNGVYELELIDCLNEELRKLVSCCVKARPDERADVHKSYELIKKLLEISTDETFEPTIDETETNLIRPIGFDGTTNSVAVDLLDVSLLPERGTLISSTRICMPKFETPQVETQTLLREPETVLNQSEPRTEPHSAKPIRIYALLALTIFVLFIITFSTMLHYWQFSGRISTSIMESSNSTKLINKQDQNLTDLNQYEVPRRLCGKRLVNTLNKACSGVTKSPEADATEARSSRLIVTKCCVKKCTLEDIQKYCSKVLQRSRK